jgi:hypothetical protein
MTVQDRVFLERAASSRAPPSPPKPTAHSALFWALVTAALQTVGVGSGLFMALWPENPASASVAHLVLPFIAAPLIAVALGLLWHRMLPIFAHDATLRKHIIAASICVLLTAMGIGTSGGNLAGLLGGESARQAHEQKSVTALRHEIETVKSNAAIETPLLANIEQATQALLTSAAAENNRSVVRKTTGGKGTTYNSLTDAAANCQKVAATMRQQSAERDRLLKTAETALGEARRASEASDADKFADAYGRAATAVSSADKIFLAATASALGRGLALDRAATPFVTNTFAEIGKVSQEVSASWQAVDVPTYERISEREAVRRYPSAAFLPWVVAIILESLALMWVPALLTLWRSPDDDEHAPPETAAWPVPVYAPVRSTQQAAE